MVDVQEKSPFLNDVQKEALRGLFSAAFETARAFNGSEKSGRALQNSLVLIEDFTQAHRGVSDVGGDLDFEALQIVFARQAGINDARPAYAILTDTLDQFYGDLEGLSLADVLSIMEDAGAAILYSDDVYVESDEGALVAGVDPQSEYVPAHFIPKLVYLMDALRSLPGVAQTHMDDVIVHVGQRRDNMLRQQPYLIVDIPWMNKQIALCNESGQITFLYDGMMNPKIFTDMPKSFLNGIEGMGRLKFFDAQHFQENLQVFLSEGLPEKRKKPNVQKEAEKALRRKAMPYTLEMVLAAAEAEYAASVAAGAPRRPSVVDKDLIAHARMKAFQTNWTAVDAHFRVGRFKDSGFGSLAGFLDHHDVGVVQHYTLDDVLAAARAEYAASVAAGAPRRPSSGDTDSIAYAPMDGFQTNWKALDKHFRVGRFKDSGFGSFSDFLDHHGVGVYSLEDVLAAARAEYAASVAAGVSRRPCLNDKDPIAHAPMAAFQTAWKAVNAHFRNRGRFKDSGFGSLADFLDRHGVITGRPLPPWAGDDLGAAIEQEHADLAL